MGPLLSLLVNKTYSCRCCYQHEKRWGNSPHVQLLSLEMILAMDPLPLLNLRSPQLLYWWCELHHKRMLNMSQYKNLGHPPANEHRPVNQHTFISYDYALITWKRIHIHYFGHWAFHRCHDRCSTWVFLLETFKRVIKNSMLQTPSCRATSHSGTA
jgi:hypothetical protein